MKDLHQIGMLWMRGSLSFLEQLCVKSFVDAGHCTILYTYANVDKVPEGVELRNADDILSGTGVLIHQRTGSPALHSDLFRYHMLRGADHMIWADTDAYCRKPFVTKTGHFFGWENAKHINGGVLGLPSQSAALNGLLEHCSDEFAILTWYSEEYTKKLEEKKAAGKPVHAGEQPWGVWGAHAVSHFLHKTGEDKHAFPQEGLYPYTFRDRRKIVRPNNKISDYVTDNTYSVHLYGRRMRKFLAEAYQGVPDPTGLLGQLLIKHKINPLDAPLSDYPNPDRDSKFAKVFREEIDGKQYFLPKTLINQGLSPVVKQDAKPLNRVVGITTIKNEGPYIIDWIGYHLWLGFTHFLVYTNDCTDGTYEILKHLDRRGLVTLVDNPADIAAGQKPQRVALEMAKDHPVVKSADACMVFDIDEYINIHTPEGTLQSLLELCGNPDMISMTWRFFGCAGVTNFADHPVPLQFERCSSLCVSKPHQNWGFKTFFHMPSAYSELGIHRPRNANGDKIARWANGSGMQMPQSYLNNGWRSTSQSWGYNLVTLNHYLRSLDGYLVKRERGRANHINRTQGTSYWNVRNRNDQIDTSIHGNFAKAKTLINTLRSDPELFRLHEESCNWHRHRINILKEKKDYNHMYQNLAKDPLANNVVEGESLDMVSLPKLPFSGNVFKP